ncbi:MAG: PEP-CTERM sorting domain-containing protein [Aquabacterium sp.]|uniref:PEP-CTERM sorting domain-containing protein n=1 Tax=Aquabacterium sp. TaxID=1872578 RepID=UPI0025C2FE53|nr:PEP-CTERM sorting domain-containing protein [Aquabacterium sp.]MBI3382384.1 PEP-CTERM sorting domain-containing protein [Aquabacterium sp.]
MSKAIFRTLTSVALATSLVAASSVASATTTADVAFLPALTDSFSFFGVTISASGSGTYANNTFSAATSDLAAGGTQLNWAPTAALTFTIAGNGAMTFDGLVYNNTTSSVVGDIHFVNGTTTFDFNDVTVFSVSPLTPAFSTLTTGGSVSGAFALSSAGLGTVTKTLGITIPIPTQNVGTLTFTATTPVPVPEPTTWALVFTGLIGLGVSGVTRRRRQG